MTAFFAGGLYDATAGGGITRQQDISPEVVRILRLDVVKYTRPVVFVYNIITVVGAVEKYSWWWKSS